MKRLIRCNISGHDPTVSVPGRDLLTKELMVMGSRYATKQEVIDALDLVARGDIWPLVTDVRPMAEAEARCIKASRRARSPAAPRS